MAYTGHISALFSSYLLLYTSDGHVINILEDGCGKCRRPRNKRHRHATARAFI